MFNRYNNKCNTIKYVLSVLLVVFLSACQTPLPVFEQTEQPAAAAEQNTECLSQQQATNNIQYDYLLYANKMVDSMVKSHNVQEKLKQNRLKVYLQSIVNNTADNIDVSAIDYAIKNRVIRSGKFIPSDTKDNADYLISGSINKIDGANNCDTGQRMFNLSLTGIKQAIVLWSEYKNLN